MNNTKTNITEKQLNPISGAFMLCVIIIGLLLTAGGFILGCSGLITTCIDGAEGISVILNFLCFILSIILFIVFCVMFAGLKVLNPNEALVLTLFGKYYGTISKPGFHFVNPLVTAVNPAVQRHTVAPGQPAVAVNKKISTKTMTLNNEKQKVNDVLGNPIIIGAIVIWRIDNPTKAVFNVENYNRYLSTQCDSIIRNTARLYPYDTMENEGDADEKTLRGSSQEIADIMKKELQERVDDAGLFIEEIRITHLAYSEEIAAAMLQRQQATAIIAARQKIVEGAVSMVKMAIDQLGEEDIVVLDEERKAAMVSNLLVVLCGNKDAQPIVNSGSIY